MDALSNIDKSYITGFVQKERAAHPDWFVVTSAKNFASPAELIVYFSAFCLALQHANKALTEIDKILRRVKSIFSTWRGISSEKPGTGGKSKGIRLKIEEKVIIVIYRSMCSGTGGARKEEIVQSLGISIDEVEPILRQLLTNGVLSQSQRTERWFLLVA
jgi:hypothetical protein